MAVIVQIADAVVADLNGAELSQPFTAKRVYAPTFTLSEMADLQVTVVPQAVKVQPGGRSHNQHDYAIDVAVQQKLQNLENETVDALMSLVEEIADHFRMKRLPSYPNAVWVKTEYKAIFAPDHLDQMRQFTSLLTFTFRIGR